MALDGFDLALTPGRCVVLLGHNGSGKTTAILCMTGRLRPTDGTVRVGGRDLHDDTNAHDARAAISLVADTPVFYPDLTVREHLELVALAHALPGDRDTVIDELLVDLGLADRQGFLPAQLSSGMRQKTQLACALARPFQVLMLDEPVLRLDPASAEQLRERLLGLKKQGVALLITTHQPAFTRDLADRVLILEDGRVQANGDFEEVAAGPQAARLGWR